MEAEDRNRVARRLAAGDHGALGALYVSTYAELVRRALAITRELATAEDVVHDVFCDLPRTIGMYSGRGRLEAWLGRVVDRAAFGALRREKTYRRVARNAVGLDAGWHQPDLLAGLALEEALGRLRPGNRDVWFLKEVLGYTHEEIGKRLGISWQASGARSFRVKRKLREILDAAPVETEGRERRDAG